jgi:polar amino acid transport system substrate-binding protein
VATAFKSRRDILKGGMMGAGALGLAAVAAACQSSNTTATSGSGTSLLDVVQKRGFMRAGVTFSLPPFGYLDSNNNPVGFDVDICRQLGVYLFKDPKKVTFVEQQFDARLPNTVAGKVDLTCEALTLTAPRGLVAEFTIPYWRDGSTLMVLSSSHYHGSEDMLGHKLKVSGLNNGFLDQTIKAGLDDGVPVGFSSDALALQALISGQVDAYAASTANAGYLIAQNPGKYRTSIEYQPQTYGMAVAPGDPKWLNWLNVAIHEMLTGVDYLVMAALYKKYMGLIVQTPIIGFPLEYGRAISA